MVKLEKSSYGAAYALYMSNEAFFPLIGSVLLAEQNGEVYADNLVIPKQFYVQHAFGFAQIFGSPVPEFELALSSYLLVDRQFSVEKVRLYTPYLPDFLGFSEFDSLCSYRQRFVLDTTSKPFADSQSHIISPDVKICGVNTNNVAEIETLFGVVGRFWRSAEDFIAKANAVVALIDDQPAAICYAAAVASGYAEIDVFTLPEFRHLGLGKIVVTRFNQQCLESGCRPLWDCFTNNTGSMALCQSTGFIPVRDVYSFFTINR